MNFTTDHSRSWALAYRAMCARLAPRCAHPDCPRSASSWTRLCHHPGVLFQGSRYCLEACLERSLVDAFGRVRAQARSAPPRHRIPLGLLLVSRQQLTVEHLRMALEAQRAAGYGRIGEWLQHMGFSTEQQITAALARQWSCPLLRSDTFGRRAGGVPHIPLALLHWRFMAPLDFVEPTATLHMAFGGELDHTSLYAIEHILGWRTEACLVVPSLLQSYLAKLPEARGESEVVFERVTDASELAHIVSSYCARISASEIRLAACGPHLWIRLLRSPSRPSMDLLLYSFAERSGTRQSPALPFQVTAV